jgi:hypothetical protein
MDFQLLRSEKCSTTPMSSSYEHNAREPQVQRGTVTWQCNGEKETEG